jgi:hypothetical protein
MVTIPIQAEIAVQFDLDNTNDLSLLVYAPGHSEPIEIAVDEGPFQDALRKLGCEGFGHLVGPTSA